VGRLVSRYYGGVIALSGRIWNLVNFQMWWERYVDPVRTNPMPR
jgi:hypothetical protein